jgi:hypothetical protein
MSDTKWSYIQDGNPSVKAITFVLWKSLRTFNWSSKYKSVFRAVGQELLLHDPSDSFTVSLSAKKEVNEQIKMTKQRKYVERTGS